jgi:CBS domain-containing protein
MKITVRRMLERKGSQVWSVLPGIKVYEALELMSEKEVGALLVMEGENLLGIMSERDYARKVVLKGKSSKDTLVREIMSSEVFYISPAYTAEECMTLMLEKRIRHLPVFEDNKLLGIISIGDVVKAVIDGKEHEINELANYITGNR